MRSTNIAPGVVVVPLNLPGPEYEGLTPTYDFKELIGAGGFGEVWRTRRRGTGDWHEHVTKVSFDPPESDRVTLAWHGTTAVAAQPPHPHLCRVGIVSWGSGRLWVSSELADGNMAGLAGGAARLLGVTRNAVRRHGLAATGSDEGETKNRLENQPIRTVRQRPARRAGRGRKKRPTGDRPRWCAVTRTGNRYRRPTVTSSPAGCSGAP